MQPLHCTAVDGGMLSYEVEALWDYALTFEVPQHGLSKHTLLQGQMIAPSHAAVDTAYTTGEGSSECL